MSAFSAAFNQFFSFIAVCFSALEKMGKTVDNLATVAEEGSGAYKDQARIDREIKIKALEASREQRIKNAQALLEAPATTA